MAATAPVSDSAEGPVLSLINKRLRALLKKHNRIIQLEDSISQGKPINKEQEEFLRSKPSVIAAIDELKKLRAPLSSAVSEEISLALERDSKEGVVEDLLNVLYFGSMFDVKSQSDFSATMLTRSHERECCLTYDYVSDDASETDLLGENDLDFISQLRALLISRPVAFGLSHKDALRRCIHHANLWLTNSDLPIHDNANVSYAGLREKLNKIMASDYFTITPEIKAPVEVAAANNYASFQVAVHGMPASLPVQVEDSVPQYEPKEEETINFEGHEISDNQSTPTDEFQQNRVEAEIPIEEVSGEQEQIDQPAEAEHSQRELEPKDQQYGSRRNYQNQRGGRGGGGGGLRGYSNGRGSRIGGRGGGGYQNGRNQYYDQPGGNYYPRNYYNNRGRGGRGGGHPYNNHGTGVAGGHAPADVGVAS